MPNSEVERVVDEMVKSGRVSTDMRNEYISLIESGLGDHLLRGSDYTNKTKALADERRQAEAWLQQEKQKLQQDRQKLDGWYNQVQGELTDYEKLKPVAAAYKQKLVDYSIYDEAEDNLSRSASSTPTYKPSVNPTNTLPSTNRGFLTIDDANKFGGNLLNLVKTVNKINNEHQRLYNQPLEDDLIDHFIQTGEDPYEHWRVKYAVDNRKAELTHQQREAEIAKIREEERAKILSEYSSDPSRITGAPFSSPKSGLTPVMEKYAASRALAHSQPHANDTAATQGKDNFIPPEMKSDIVAGRDRVNSAVDMFHKNFDVTGQPISDQGRQLARKYVFND